MTGNSIDVFTNDYLKAKVYNLKVVASVGSYKSTEVPFTVTIIHSGICLIATVLPETIENKVYTVGSTALNFQFPAWSDTIGVCGSIAYSILISPTVNFITLNSSTRTISIYTDSFDNGGSYEITVTGSLSNGNSATTIFTLDVNFNTAPYFTQLIPDQVLYEKSNRTVALP